VPADAHRAEVAAISGSARDTEQAKAEGTRAPTSHEGNGQAIVAESLPLPSAASATLRPVPARPGTFLRRIPGWLIAGVVYLTGGVVLWWHVWTGHPTSTMTCACGDPASFVWFLDWPAYAITHGHSLFFSARAHVPDGINLLDNTSVLALGVALAPITWLFGPIATLNVALTVAPAASGLAAYATLRRGLGLRWAAAFLGGLAFGFSPFMMRNEAVGHLQVTFLALPPLIFWCCYELAVTQRGKWWRWGLALGLLITVQFFIGTEVLSITAMMAGLCLLVAVCAAALARPDVVSAKLPFAWRGFVLAGAVAGLLLAYPLWFTLVGPEAIRGGVWSFVSTNGLLRVLLPLSQSSFQQAHLPMIGYLGPAGTLGAYLGIPALAVLLLAVVVTRRRLAMLCAILTVVSVWLSLGSTYLRVSHGGEPSWLWLPWRAVDHLPVLNKITPANFSAAAAWFVVLAAAVLVDGLLRAPWAARSQADAGRPGSADPAGRADPPGTRLRTALVGRPARMVAAGAVSAALLAPWLLAWPLPFTVRPVSTPAWVTRVGARLPASAVVLFYPFPSSYQDQALVWQAGQGMRYSLVGGRGIVAADSGGADHGFTRGTPEGQMSALTTSYAPHSAMRLPRQPDLAAIHRFRDALRSWGVTTVVMTPGGRDPGYARQWLATVLGSEPRREFGAWVWNDVQRLPG
jgi:hypothetical protein